MRLNPTNTSIVKRLLVGRSSRPLYSILNKIEPADLASLFSTLSVRECRLLVNALMTIDKAPIVLLELPEPKLSDLLKKLDNETLVSLVAYSSDDDSAHFLSQLDETERQALLLQLEKPKRNRIEQHLNYPEESAGRMMQTKPFSLPDHLTAAEGLDDLRARAQNESIYYIYCVDESDRLVGVVSLRALATAPPDKTLNELAKKDLITVTPKTSSEDVAKLVAHYDFVAIPVVNDVKELVGIITVDDVIDIIQEQATADIYAQAGLQEDDRVYTSVSKSIKNRIPWMFLNLLLAALASSVVSLFENTMHELIILASLKNIVAGMGGNTAIQSLTVVTRGIAVGDFSFISRFRAVLKELSVGIVIGCVTGLAAAILVYFWKENSMVAIVIFCSMVLNSIIASFAGASVPLLLKKYGWDPATGSGVLVTMITDIFSFFSFLGIATLGIKYFT